MRFDDWKVSRGKGRITGEMIDVGKKLLGYLAGQRKLNGVETQKKQITLSDGSVVRAAFHKGVPIVEYFPAVVATARKTGCDIIMESGMLDLGANTASMAQKVTFTDADATLYFGATSKISDRPIGAKLSVYVTDDGEYSFIGESLSATTDSVDSNALNGATAYGYTVARNDKRTVQGRLQSSMWTGLMHRYVQALYGTPGAVYFPYEFQIIPEYSYRSTRVAMAVPDISSTEMDQVPYVLQYWGTFTSGLIDPDSSYRYWFVRAFDNQLECTPGVVVGTCAKLLLKALRANAVPTAHKKRIETYLLSSLVPDRTNMVVLPFTTDVVGFPVAYGWKFNERGSEIAMVVHDHNNDTTQVVTRVLGYDVDDNLAVLDEIDSATTRWFPPIDADWPGQIMFASPDTNATMYRYDVGLDGTWGDLESFDAPVYCYYITQTDEDADDFGDNTVLEVVKSKFTAGGTVIAKGKDSCSAAAPSSLRWPCWGPESVFNNECRSMTRSDTISVTGGYYTARASAVRVMTLQISGDWVSFGGQTNEAKHYDNLTFTTVYDVERGIAGQDPPPPHGVVEPYITGYESGTTPVYTYFGTPTAVHWFENTNSLATANANYKSFNLHSTPFIGGTPSPECDCPVYDTTTQTTAHRRYESICPAASTVDDPGDPSAVYYFGFGSYIRDIRSVRESDTLLHIDVYSFTASTYLEKSTHLIIPCGNASAVAFREYDHEVCQGNRYHNAFDNEGSDLTFTESAGSVFPPAWSMGERSQVDFDTNGDVNITDACTYYPVGGIGTVQLRTPPTATSSDTGDPTSIQKGSSRLNGDPAEYEPMPGTHDIMELSTIRGIQEVRGTWLEQDGTFATAVGNGSISEDDGDEGTADGVSPLCGDVDLSLHEAVSDAPLLNRGLTESDSYAWTEEYNPNGFFMIGNDAIRYYAGQAGGRVRFDDFAHLTSQKHSPGTALSWSAGYPAVAFPSFVGWA